MYRYDFRPYLKYRDKYLLYMNELHYPAIKKIKINRIKVFDGRNIFSHNKCVLLDIVEVCSGTI
ncbi:MAG TPA: hypothetical protein DGK91_01325 [Clostridium sp.]|jgi:hypothetical protein|nr:hypothetical protein [Clostridium sp.]